MTTLSIADIIQAAEKDTNLRSELRTPDFQEQFKQYVSNVGSIAMAIERRETPAEEEQLQLHRVGNTVLRFYELDADAMQAAFLFSNYSPEQCVEIRDACRDTVKNLKTTAVLTFDSHKNNTNLMQDPRTRRLVHGNRLNKLSSESMQKAFIQYLQHEGLPAEVLERMARLSLYQEYYLASDLKTESKLLGYYKEFSTKGSLATSTIIQATELMETLMLNRMRENRVVLERNTKDGLDIARSKKTDRAGIATLYNAATARELDAYVVHNGLLVAACVTTHTDLEKNALSALSFLRATHHSFINDVSLLTGIKDAKVQVYCNSEPTARRELLSALAYLKTRGSMQPGQEKHFVELPLHQEILKFMSNMATPEYDIYSSKITLGIYGSNQSNLTLQAEQTAQIKESINAIADAANALALVVSANPRLDKILGATEQLGRQLSESYTYAMELRQRHSLMMDANISGKLDNIQDVLMELHNNLTSAGSRYTSGVMPRVTPDRAVLLRHEQLANIFENRENALRNGTPTAYALQKEKQYSNWGQTGAASIRPNHLSSLLNGTSQYKGNTNYALLRDGLMERAKIMEQMLIDKTFTKVSMKPLLKGMSRLKDANMLTEVYQYVFKAAPLLTAHVLTKTEELGAKDSSIAQVHAALSNISKRAAQEKQKANAISSETSLEM